MSNAQILETKDSQVTLQPSSDWFAEFSRRGPADSSRARRLITGNDSSGRLYLVGEGDTLPGFAARLGCGVVLDGTLYNRADLQAELQDDFSLDERSGDAEVILAGYERQGEGFLKRLRGTFTLLIWDSERDVLLCVRDPMGNCPLFYADGRDGLFFATSIPVLLRQPGVSRSINRAALADHLVDRLPGLEETFYEAVKRVPPGNVLRIKGKDRRCYRYWDPAPEGEVKWLTADEVNQFDEVFDRAVGRCLGFGQTGIFLSGGLDSVSVAAFATARTRADGLPKPWALSLAFPDRDTNEEVVQKGVAQHLGLSQVIKPFFEATAATGLEGLLAPGLELSSSMSSPLMNPWLPAYYDLAKEGSRRGCRAILTGGGGDEWLCIGPFLAADLLRKFDLGGFYQLWRSERRSYRRSSLALLWGLLWRFGVQPLFLPSVHRFVKQVAPWALTLRHRLSSTPPSWIPPAWLAPDPTLRAEIERRRVEPVESAGAVNSDSFYTREMRKSLDHSLGSFDLEENFEIYQRVGVRVLQPFMDADLVDMLYRTPPFLLNQGGRTKGLVRSSLARRFPDLGFEQQRKVIASNFYAASIHRDGGKVWQQMGGVSALAELGIVDEQGVRPTLEGFLNRGPELQAAYRFWNILNLESWARTHV